MKNSILANYVFRWKRDKAIVLGFGLFYNYSYSQNAYYITNFDNISIDSYARRDINKGEEIRVNYNGNPRDTSSLWFDVIN
ncbi:SET domain-containing protein-lysine N-methyltransferase [Pallidibacillus pasinlerensis]|nr:SET domain-containing protein-lysine N-methyltransferase [Pallidibacillus pasinlerensis]